MKKFILDIWSTEPLCRAIDVIDKRQFAFYPMQATMMDSWSSDLKGGNHTSPHFYMNPQYLVASLNHEQSHVYIKLESSTEIPVGLYLFELQNEIGASSSLQESITSVEQLSQSCLRNGLFNKAFMFYVNTLQATLQPGKRYLVVCSTLEESKVNSKFNSNKSNKFKLTMFFDNDIIYKKTLPLQYKETFNCQLSSIPFNFLSSSMDNSIELICFKETNARISCYLDQQSLKFQEKMKLTQRNHSQFRLGQFESSHLTSEELYTVLIIEVSSIH